MSEKPQPDRRYYSIGEVARMTELEPYVLRYWEKEFPLLKPRKNRGGNRLYTVKDIEIINQIKHLRHTEGLTIAGTRIRLQMRRKGETSGSHVEAAKMKTLIAGIRRDIDELLKLFS